MPRPYTLFQHRVQRGTTRYNEDKLILGPVLAPILRMRELYSPNLQSVSPILLSKVTELSLY